MADYHYEKVNKDFCAEVCPARDIDGTITGHIVINLKEWFDEHPEERKRLGWIKHISHDESEIDYDPQTQFVVKSLATIDEYTVEDIFHVVDKSEEVMRLEEMIELINLNRPFHGITFTV